VKKNGLSFTFDVSLFTNFIELLKLNGASQAKYNRRSIAD